jgi:hypothetical protein
MNKKKDSKANDKTDAAAADATTDKTQADDKKDAASS